MGQKFVKVSQKLKKLMNNPQKKRSWQGGIGITIFALFVLSSVVVNRSVQALNQAAGNYGYYNGTYGYNDSTTSSDQVPSAPTAFSASVTQTTASLSWTAPTTTTDSTAISTGSGSISSYKFHYSTSSLSSCSGGTSSTPTSASTSLTGLTAGTTYYVAICATDNNINDSAALTGSFTTQSTGGGGAVVSGGGAAPSGPTYPTAAPAAPAAPVAPPAVTPPAVPPGLPVAVSRVADVANVANVLVAVGARRNTTAEGQSATRVDASVRELRVTLTAEARNAAVNFVTYGISTATVRLGSGERLALVRDQLETLGRINPVALEQLATGQKPTERNLSKEQAQLANVLSVFQKIAGHRPNFRVVAEDLAWNTMMYRVRFARDLNKERIGIGKFRQVFRRTPASPLDWAAVRAWGYALR